MIIATAGHVDHGKTSLVKALTGIDTTHLPEERRRGLTIALGFAGLALPGGGRLSFVDVPGHEKFVRTMIAGVTGVRAALLVVAADDGIMPQTREHLEILHLLDIPDIVVALTKCDRVASGRLQEAMDSVRMLLDAAGRSGSPIVPVSSHTGEGIENLRLILMDRANRQDGTAEGGTFRLPIDRVFVVDGAGLVVTGTVAAGRVRVDDDLVVAPGGLSARVRGVQVFSQAAPLAVQGDRCALNLSGQDVDRDHIGPGQWLASPWADSTVQAMDVTLTAAEGAALKDGAVVQLCHGTAAVQARLVLLDHSAQPVLAQLVSETPLHAVARDRFVLRDTAHMRTLAGGRVLDPFPPRRGRKGAARIGVLRAMDRPDPATALAAVITTDTGIRLQDFALGWGLAPPEMDVLARAEDLVRADEWAWRRPVWTAARAALVGAVERWHASHPYNTGPTETDLVRTTPELTRNLRQAALVSLIRDRSLLRDGRSFRHPDHAIRLTGEQAALWSRVAPLVDGPRPFAPTSVARELREPPPAVQEVMDLACRTGALVRIGASRYLTPRRIAELEELARSIAAEDQSGGFDAGVYRDRSGLGRNFAIDVLEYFDRVGFTVRTGERRRIARPPAEVRSGGPP